MSIIQHQNDDESKLSIGFSLLKRWKVYSEIENGYFKAHTAKKANKFVNDADVGAQPGQSVL